MPDEEQRWRTSIEGRLDRHGQQLTELRTSVNTLHQVVFGPEATNGLRQEVRANQQEIRQLRESRGEAQAVTQAKKAVIRLVAAVIVAQVAIFTLLLRIAEVI